MKRQNLLLIGIILLQGYSININNCFYLKQINKLQYDSLHQNTMPNKVKVITSNYLLMNSYVYFTKNQRKKVIKGLDFKNSIDTIYMVDLIHLPSIFVGNTYIYSKTSQIFCGYNWDNVDRGKEIIRMKIQLDSINMNLIPIKYFEDHKFSKLINDIKGSSVINDGDVIFLTKLIINKGHINVESICYESFIINEIKLK
jgi:hypothetical protein